MKIAKRNDRDYKLSYRFLVNRLKVIRDESATLCEFETDVLIGAIFTLADKHDIFIESDPHTFPNIRVKIFDSIVSHPNGDFYGTMTLEVTPSTWSVKLGVVIPGYHGPESVQEASERIDFDYVLNAVDYILDENNITWCRKRIYQIGDEIYKKG